MIYTNEITLKVQSVFGLNASEYSADCIRNKLSDKIYEYEQIILNAPESDDIDIYRTKLAHVRDVDTLFMDRYLKELT